MVLLFLCNYPGAAVSCSRLMPRLTFETDSNASFMHFVNRDTIMSVTAQ